MGLGPSGNLSSTDDVVFTKALLNIRHSARGYSADGRTNVFRLRPPVDFYVCKRVEVFRPWRGVSHQDKGGSGAV